MADIHGLGSGDDFITPSNPDLSTECTVLNSSNTLSVYLPLCGALSIICYIYLFWMYFVLKSPVLKRHPTTLAIYKCMIEVLFVQQYLWVPQLGARALYSDDSTVAPFYCNSSRLAAFMAFVSQFSLLGSELCFWIISLDLRKAYTNPFTSFKQNKVYYLTLVLGISTATAAIVLLCGPQVFGMSRLGIIWIQARRESRSPNYPQFVLFYFPSLVIFGYCIWANFQFYQGVNKGLSKTLNSRISIMERSRRYTAAYVVYGLVVFAIEFVSFLSNTNVLRVSPVPAFFYAMRGIWGLLIIFYSNYSELSWQELNPFRLQLPQELVQDVAKERLLLQPHLNTALRAEILYFATQGIIHAALERSGRPLSFRVPREDIISGNNQLNTNTLSRLSEEKQDSDSGDVSETESEDAEKEEARLFSYDMSPDGIRPSLATVSTHQTSARASWRATAPLQSFFNALTGSHANTSTTNTAASRPSLTPQGDRETFSHLQRIEDEQSKRLSRLYHTALASEVESLGGPGVHQQEHNRDEAHPITSSQSHHNNSDDAIQSIENPMYAGRRSGAISISKPGRVETSSVGIEMRDSMNQSRARSEQESTDSSDTIKWRDTMDVEYGLRSSGEQAHQQSPSMAQRLTAGWRRVQGQQGNAEDANNDMGRKTSTASESSSQSDSSRIGRALLSAVDRARAALSPAYREFRFKDFLPRIFAKLRALKGISPDDYAAAFETTCRERFSEGRSGAFLFFSKDQRFIVKTMSETESIALRKSLPDYLVHLSAQPQSLLVRFLGAHSLTMYGVEIFFVVMLNVFPLMPLSERFDLKGSWVNRHGKSDSAARKKKRTQKKPRRAKVDRTKSRNTSMYEGDGSNVETEDEADVVVEDGPDKETPLYQDNDLQQAIVLETDTVTMLAEIIRRDVIFLRNLNFMDYSLLIGVRRERFKVLNPDEEAARASMSVDDDNGRPSSTGWPQTRGARAPSEVVPLHSSSFSSSRTVSRGGPPQTRGADVWRLPNASSVAQMNTTTLALSGDVNGSFFADGIRAAVVEGPGTYYLGIIDVLQQWDWKKRIERFFKTTVRFKDGDGLSAIDPERYATRFWQRAVLDTFEGLDSFDDDLDAPPPLPITHVQSTNGTRPLPNLK